MRSIGHSARRVKSIQPEMSPMPPTVQRETAYCPKCKETFLSYNLARSTCPRCGRRCYSLASRRLLRKLALVLLLALVVGGAAAAFLYLR